MAMGKARATRSERFESPLFRSLLEHFGGRRQALAMLRIAPELSAVCFLPEMLPKRSLGVTIIKIWYKLAAKKDRGGEGSGRHRCWRIPLIASLL